MTKKTSNGHSKKGLARGLGELLAAEKAPKPATVTSAACECGKPFYTGMAQAGGVMYTVAFRCGAECGRVWNKVMTKEQANAVRALHVKDDAY